MDGLAGTVAGTIALRDPAGAWPRVDAWAADEDFWVRRSGAALAAARHPRRAAGPAALHPVRGADADAEREFFIRKAIGWVLREIYPARRPPGGGVDRSPILRDARA